MSEKSKLLSEPPPQSPILGDFEGGLVRKSCPRMGGWGASARIFDTSQTSSKGREQKIGQLQADFELIFHADLHVLL
ncbi:MAG: hypothetical protein KME11_20035 [Timaviella obliquedivisa GSE-PSE-MK23-08B]|nr:hypothetical protein [Timaviella obliquedivisa GSE-PSE-MK23-08B]